MKLLANIVIVINLSGTRRSNSRALINHWEAVLFELFNRKFKGFSRLRNSFEKVS